MMKRLFLPKMTGGPEGRDEDLGLTILPPLVAVGLPDN